MKELQDVNLSAMCGQLSCDVTMLTAQRTRLTSYSLRESKGSLKGKIDVSSKGPSSGFPPSLISATISAIFGFTFDTWVLTPNTYGAHWQGPRASKLWLIFSRVHDPANLFVSWFRLCLRTFVLLFVSSPFFYNSTLKLIYTIKNSAYINWDILNV